MALDSFRATLKLNPLSKIAWNNSGVICQQIGMLDLAGKYFQKALELEENDPVSVRNLAFLKLNTGNYNEGFQLCEKLMVLVPDNPVGYYLKGLLLMKTENLMEALENLDKSLNLGEN